jgi:ABC-type branched-subunit amino acid transport system permease subunit
MQANRVYVAMAIVGAGLAAVPMLGLPLFYESFCYLVFHWIVLATSWNILSGYSGYFSFGHGAFFGAGMYTTATLAAKVDVPFRCRRPPSWRSSSARRWAPSSFASRACAASSSHW